MPRLPTLVVLSIAVSFALVAIAGLVSPAAILDPVGVRGDIVGTIELRAMYGGLQLGLAGFLLWCVRAGHEEAGVAAATMTLGGLGAVRAAGWLAAGAPASLHALLVAVELGGTAIGAVAWGRARRGGG